jgi:H+/Cl- antiporter ClcA
VSAHSRTPSAVSSAVSRIGGAVQQNATRLNTALKDFSTRVTADDDSKKFSSLQATTFSILDVYNSDDTEPSANIGAELQRREAAERKMRVMLASQPPSSSSGSLGYSPSVGGSSFSTRPSSRRCACFTNCCGRCWLRLSQRFLAFTSAPKSWLYLLLLGFLAAIVAAAVDGPVIALANWRSKALASVSVPVGYFIALPWCIGFTLLAAFVVHKVPLADGSGIPQLRSILAGTSLPQYLSFKVGFAKLLSVTCAIAAGLSIGREGPFVHLASVVASLLLKVPYFKDLGKNESMRRQLLAAAVAAGVTATFGTPVGAVLFSVEVTSTFFLTATYFKCFLTAVVCRFTFDIIQVLKADNTFGSTTFPNGELTAEIFAFIAVGGLCGLTASLFVMAVNKCRVARKLLMTTTLRKFVLVTICAAVVSSLLYLTPYLRATDKTVVNDLFSTQPASAEPPNADVPSMALFGAPNVATVLFSLAIYLGVRLLATVISISLPLASGLFVPLLVCGAVVGRFCGELLQIILPNANLSSPGVYAVIGAAALASGATQTVSTAVIVFELTGQTAYLLPVLLATLVSYSVSGLFSISIYDLLLTLSGLPYLPRVYNSSVYSLSAGQIMHSTGDGDAGFLTLNSTYTDALNLLLTGASSSSSDGGPICPSGRYPCLAVAAAVDSCSSASSSNPSGSASARASSGNGNKKKGDDFADFTQVQTGIALVDDAAGMTLLGVINRAKLEQIFQRRAALYKLQKRAEMVGTANGVKINTDRQQLLANGGGLPLANGSSSGPSESNSSTLGAVANWLNRTLTRDDESHGGPVGEGTALTATGAAKSSSSSAPGLMRFRSRFRQWVLGDEPLSSLELPEDFLNAKLCFRGLPHHLLSRPSMHYSRNAGGAAATSTTAPAVDTTTAVSSSSSSASSGAAPLRSEAISSDSLVCVDAAPFTVSDATPLSRVHYLFAVILLPEIICVSTEGKFSGVILKNDLSHSKRLQRDRSANNAAPHASVNSTLSLAAADEEEGEDAENVSVSLDRRSQSNESTGGPSLGQGDKTEPLAPPNAVVPTFGSSGAGGGGGIL